jgi:hypothetical protein
VDPEDIIALGKPEDIQHNIETPEQDPKQKNEDDHMSHSSDEPNPSNILETDDEDDVDDNNKDGEDEDERRVTVTRS